MKDSKAKYSITTIVIVAIVAALLAFYGGIQYQKAHASTVAGSFASRVGQDSALGQRGSGGRGGRGFGGATLGQILSVDSNSITVKLQDGSSKIVNISNSTTFSKTDTASKADLKTGINVAAFGTPNSDGSINAQNVQLNPAFRQGRPPIGGQVAQPSPTQ